ncbi:SDR family oxidoreductase [Pseudomonas piscis]|uniref:SDR family oxidoreductase n=1 Tax=Pseudomonas piscis TaxID=2614538 RepID=UPI0021D5F4BB|nr:SDR family oxidoreductase [Pseudomonas piscis]MCU7645861.1 SDR family oxidoreductase [Pseudomonas piscis]
MSTCGPSPPKLQVQVNALAPGMVDTLLHPAEPQIRAALQALAPSGRIGVETARVIRRRERSRRG